MEKLDYKDDPRAVLIHAGGNPYHDPRNGQFTTASKGFGFGRRKYVNKDGSLTEAGKARLELEKRRNLKKKKDDQVKPKDGMTVDEILNDPDAWVKSDLNAMETSFKESSKVLGDVNTMLKRSEANKPQKRRKNLKLDDMSDAELQAQINRYLLEQRYQDIFNPKQPPEVKEGKKFLMNALEVGGSVLAVGASAVTIAKAIHEMRS